ncbi:MAG: hypothetical protein K5761_08630, partial [Clostridiales bacterium]|nr:hypothetical protein [Clostridiales bacterium]
EYKDQVLQYQSRNENLANAERQIGVAYIEARRYSDEIIDNAKSRAKDVGAIASQDVKHQANEIEQLLRDVDAVSKKFNTSLEQLHKDVYALSTKLNNSASSLLNIHTEVPALDAPSIYEDDNIYARSSELQEETAYETAENTEEKETFAPVNEPVNDYDEDTVNKIVSEYLPNEEQNTDSLTEKPYIPEDIAKEMPDAIGVEETDDGSGLTFISYEPNSEFNEDLNIQPEQIIDTEDNNE